MGSLQKQLFYIEKLLKIDKENAETAAAVNTIFIKEYDTKKLLEEKDHLNKNQNFFYFLGGVMLVILLGSFYFLKKPTSKEAFNQNKTNVIEIPHLIKDREIEILDYEKYKPIHRSTVNFIIKQIEKFEKEKKFLRRNLKLSLLATEFNTNERYLSTIIKIKTNKNFNEYVNHLRLNYFIEESKKNEIYRKQPVRLIAENLGFTTPEMFSKEFKNFLGISPKEFLEKF